MRRLLIFMAMFSFLATPAVADSAVSSVVPVPPAETGLATETAEEIFTVTPDRTTLEGALFDAAGNLFFCDTVAGRVYRLDPNGDLALALETPGFAPSGLAFGPDGKLYLTALNLAKGEGKILALSPDGKTLETILPVELGLLPNDLVFDKAGGFYFSDFRGSATRPLGGVYYATPDRLEILPVIPAMAQANGVALSPDGKVLWATEYANNRLHRVVLDGPVDVPANGSKIAYHFIGPAPDSMRVDADGNVYVAMVGQGRVLIFNHYGFPIGQILLPGRDVGANLRSTSLAIHPERKEALVVAGQTAEAPIAEAKIFAAPAFAPAAR